MWFKRLIVQNIRTLRNIDIQFKRGLVGIFGKNGVGKSTIVDLLYASVTNDFSRFDGVKIEQISNMAGPKDKSFVYAEIEHKGKQISILRSLRPVKQELKVDDEPPLTDANKIAARLEELLGMDNKLFNLFVFKRQDSIYDFISVTDATRKKAFQLLSRTEYCEELWELVGEVGAADDLKIEIIDNSDVLAAEIATMEAEVESWEQEIEGERKTLLNAKSKESAEKLVNARNSLPALEEKRRKLNKEIKEYREKVTTLQDRYDRRISRKEVVAKLKVDYAEPAQLARTALSNWDEYEKNQKYLKGLEDKAAQLAKDLETLEMPQPPFKTLGIELERKELVTKMEQLAHAKAVLTTFAKDKVVACPTCDTKVKDLKPHLDAMRKLKEELPDQIADLDHRIDQWADYEEELEEYTETKRQLEADLKANAEARKSAKEVKRPKGDRAELQHDVDQHDLVVKEAEEIDEKITTVTGEKATAETKLSERRKQLKKVKKEIEEATVDEELYERAKHRLAEHEVARTRISMLEGQITVKNGSIEDKQSELKELRKQLKRTKRVRKLRKILDRARDILHRDCLPNRVSQINLNRMEGDINDGLENFGNPFWVETNEDLQFVVHKPGEPQQRAGQLSTGLRVVLAIPFWLAVASLWKNDIGTLALDEPTANLDEANRSYLAEALTTLTAKLQGSRQVFMVTHADNLKPSFDQVIEVAPEMHITY
jgi:DNA repair exonuclease SbcCD ATPase subunit